jgi:RNA-directed DNA polymerase
MSVVRYADGTIVGFQHEREARTFLTNSRNECASSHLDKTRLIRFGRHAAKQRAKLGEGKP